MVVPSPYFKIWDLNITLFGTGQIDDGQVIHLLTTLPYRVILIRVLLYPCANPGSPIYTLIKFIPDLFNLSIAEWGLFFYPARL